MMPTFDRAAAKAAGYSDSEIRAMVAAGPPRATQRYEDIPGVLPDEGLIREQPIENALALAGGVKAAMALPGLVRAGAAAAGPAARGIGSMVKAVGRAAGRRTFGKGNFDDLAKEVTGAAKSMRSGAVAESAAEAVTVAPRRPNLPVKVAREAEKSDRIAVASHTRARKPAPEAKPKLEAVPRPSRPMRGASKPELERRARALEANKPRPSLPKETRHARQYYSKSRGEHIDIETMNQKHIEQAYGALARKNPKRGSVEWNQMQDLMAEAKHRLQTTGIHIGQGAQK